MATPEQFFSDDPIGLATYDAVRAAVDAFYPDVEVRVAKSQVSFRRARGFAYLWVPDRYLRGPAAPVVLSIALKERINSPRFKQVVHPGPWMHHLEVWDVAVVDDEVSGWLNRAAAEAAGDR